MTVNLKADERLLEALLLIGRGLHAIAKAAEKKEKDAQPARPR